MKETRVLITGGGGFVGAHLIGRLRDNFDVHTTYQKTVPPNGSKVTLHQIDLGEPDKLEDLLEGIKPEFVIHCAALTGLYECSYHSKRAWNLNVEVTERIARSIGKRGGKLIYLSTDMVFRGGEVPFNETDQPVPTTFYGITKLEGERSVQAFCERWTIIRPSFIYGWAYNQKKCSTELIFNSLSREKPVYLFKDELRNPTYIEHLKDVVVNILLQDMSGVFHVCSAEPISRYEFGLELARTFNLDSNLIHPSSYKGQTLRPGSIMLTSTRQTDACSWEVGNGFADMLFEIQLSNYRERNLRC